MQGKSDEPKLDRRGFLKSVGGASALGVTAVGGALVAEDAAAQESRDERRKSRYRESEHVKNYYRVNRS